MRYPDFLKKNGTIGFVAPAFGCATEPYKSGFDNAIDKFHDMGYATSEGPNCRIDEGIGISNSPQKCGQELNDEYSKGRGDILISCGGGELMCEVVPYIDFELIKNSKPKWFMGYSDNTNFTYLSAVLADTASIYGPCAAAFGMNKWHKSLEDVFGLLCGEKFEFTNYDRWELESLKSDENPYAEYNTTELSCIRSYPDVNAAFSGRLIGGCLDCLITLAGTAFDKTRDFCEKYKDDGQIWFLEACDLTAVSVRRALWQLKNAGWFKHVKGFLIGRPMHFNEEMFGINHYNAVIDMLKEFDVPIIMNVDIGHLPPMMPVVVGAMADVRCEDGKLTIDYRFE